MARFLIVGENARADLLADALVQAGHVASVVASPERGSLEHVAIVCWLAASCSPERFLLGSIDTSMRGLLYEAAPSRPDASGGANGGPSDGIGGEGASDGWEPALLEAAARNSIPVAAVRSDPNDSGAWLAEARDAIAALIAGPGRSEVPGTAV